MKIFEECPDFYKMEQNNGFALSCSCEDLKFSDKLNEN